jgi:hypothetical protein
MEILLLISNDSSGSGPAGALSVASDGWISTKESKLVGIEINSEELAEMFLIFRSQAM